MKLTTKNALIICLLFFYSGLCAQDKIYYRKNKTESWKVTEITKGYIKGADVQNPAITYSISHPDVLFIINSRGNFLVIPNLFDNKFKSDIYIKNYLQYVNNAYQKADQVITSNHIIITCDIDSEKEKEIFYKKGNKMFSISKSNVAIIIYKNGTHKLLVPAEKTYKILKNLQDRYNTAFTTIETKTRELVQTTTTRKDSAKITGESPEGPGQNKPVFTSLKTDANEPVKELDEAMLLSLQGKATANIKQLENYIKILSDKTTDADQIPKIVDQAVLLFASEESVIEVSSRNRSEAQQYKARVYLNRLGLMKYKKILIEWYNIQYASKIRKNPDGTYTGLIEFEQRFTGIWGDRKQYQDITRKTIEIVLKSYYKRSGGASTLQWDVFLGNIGISVTNPD